MKRIIACLTLLALVLCAGSACALNYAPYAVEAQYGTELYPLSGSEVMAFHQEFFSPKAPIPTSIVFWKDGKAGSPIPVHGEDESIYPFATRDGRIGLIFSKIPEHTKCRVAYWDGKKFADAFTLSKGYQTWWTGEVFLCRPMNQKDKGVKLFDADGKQVLEVRAKMGRPFDVARSRKNWVFLNSVSLDSDATQLVWIDDNGKLKVECALPDELFYNVIGDGLGGAYTWGATKADYRKTRIVHAGADGKVIFNAVLSAPDSVLGVDCAAMDERDGSLMVYGHCVANSRKMYRLFAARISADGELLACDVRDFSKPQTYNIDVKLSPAGVPWALSSSVVIPENKKGTVYAVPFAELDKGRDPGITLRAEGAAR